MTTRVLSSFFEMQDIKKKAEGKKEIVDLRPLNGGFKIFNQGEPPHDGDQASEEVFACDEQSNHQMTLLTIYIILNTLPLGIGGLLNHRVFRLIVLANDCVRTFGQLHGECFGGLFPLYPA